MLRLVKIFACLCLAMGVCSCAKTYDFKIAPPQKVNDPSSGGGGSGGGGGSTDPDAERLARLGQTPVVCVYLTEYTPSDEFPDENEIRYFTHVNYGHARFVDKKNGTGLEIAKTDYLKKLASYKTNYPKLKILLMVGGWGKNADGFSMMARDPDKRKAFCENILKACVEYNIDGVDLDWEYPGYGAKDGDYVNGYSTEDTANFTTLVKELRETLGPNRLISYAASDSGKYMDHKAALDYVDYINVMTYSMGDPPSRHNSPLYKSFQNPRGGAESIEIFVGKGVPYNRMNYGIAYYGHGDGNIYPSSVQYHRINQILTQGTWTDKGVTHDVTGYNIRWWDAAGMVPYLGDASGRMYASYEDLESIAIKITYIKAKGLLGAFGWEYREDEATGTLRHAVFNGLHGK
ncbi:MAG: hypothetical protein II466_07335 [Bacteroidales bacterium]|nr:hypothetical protein [Bacteroidales bacterium]MBQ8462376.1 hypothetical protein [Bacteroidales bacterium]MDT3360965.1 hypothetical protein [Bacteroidota bacterium]